MRLVHLSDLHLGGRAFPGTERGWNLRERDLARAFRWAVQEIVRLRPDLVLLTGDLFDRPDPPGTAQVTLHRGLRVLRSHLPGTPILAIAGERDTPSNPADPGPLALLEGISGVEAAAAAPRAVRFRETRVHALLVPHRTAREGPLPELRPDPGARFNLLLLRARPGSGEADALRVDPEAWSYVAVGGPHRAQRWAPNVHAAGALERPGRHPWSEATEERGFLTFDLATGASEFHAVPGRPVVDLAPVRISPEDPEAGTRRLREVIEGIPGGIDGKIVRVHLRGEGFVPEDGVREGLLLAIGERAAYAEFQLLGARAAGSGPGARAMGPAVALRWEGEATGGERLVLPEGLVLLTADTESLRRELAARLADSGWSGGGTEERGDGASPGVRVEATEGGAQPTLVVRRADPDPDRALRRLLRARAGTGGGGGGPSESETPSEAASGGLAALERGLVELRADAVEAAGEVEVRALDWARNRQEAESKLQDYRDRARELQLRMRELEEGGAEGGCPTCGRPLGEQAPRLVATLREEWEAVVQDGRWWKRRREQLEEKPADLREMEEGALRLHARVEAAAEHLERVRAGTRRPEEGVAAHEAGRDEGAAAAGAGGLGLPGTASLLRRTGSLLGPLSEGRLSGVRPAPSGLEVVERGGRSLRAEGSDRALLALALHLADWLERPESHAGEDVREILLVEFTELASEEAVAVALEVLSDRLPGGETVLLVAPPEALERMPERVALALAWQRGAGGRWSARRLPRGPATFVLAKPG